MPKLYELLVGKTCLRTDGDVPERYVVTRFRSNVDPYLAVFTIEDEDDGQNTREVPAYLCLGDDLVEDK